MHKTHATSKNDFRARTFLCQAIAITAHSTTDACIFHAIGEVVAGFALRTLRIRGTCARFRRGTVINLSANWVAETLDK